MSRDVNDRIDREGADGFESEPTTWRPAGSKPGPSGERPAKKPAVGPAASRSSGAGRRAASPAADDLGADRLLKSDPGAPRGIDKFVFGSVSAGQLGVFCRQLAAYQEAGVDLRKSLRNLSTQFAHSPLGPALGRIGTAIRSGDSLADAFRKEPKIFDKLFISLMQVAEARGGVPETLRELSRHYEAKQRMLRQAKSALIYPICVLTVGLGVAGLVVFVVIPVFASLLRDISRGKPLPGPTQALLALADFATSIGWWVIPALVIGTVVTLRLMYKNPRGKRLLDEVILLIPVFGLLVRKLDITRFARSLSLLLEGGVAIDDSLQLAGGVLRMSPFADAVAASRAQVLEGIELSPALEATRRFPVDLLASVAIGEETGKLPENLARIADEYESQAEFMIKNLGALLQPLIYIAMGGIVLFIILAVFLPYLQILSGLAQ